MEWVGLEWNGMDWNGMGWVGMRARPSQHSVPWWYARCEGVSAREDERKEQQ